MTVTQTEFAVNLHCQSCVDTVSNVLKGQEGITKFECNLKDQTVVVEGSVAPSKICQVLRDAGREVIIRGSGTGGDAGAAVCIFESFTPAPGSLYPKQNLFGLARFVQTSTLGTLTDLTVQQKFIQQSEQALSGPLSYDIYVGKTGDISNGISKVGGVFKSLGTVTVDPKSGYGDLFKEFNKTEVDLSTIIGRALVITPTGNRPLPTLVGVIARSSGLWGNEKTVCTCSGKTMWEENREQRVI